MGRLLPVFLCVVPMLLLTVWETEQVSVGPLEVRLVGGATTSEGRLEVRRSNSIWGTVCDDFWDIEDSKVVCRQLGLGKQGQMVSVTRYGEGTGSIWLDDVNCTGSESNLGQCSSQPWGDHNCGHNEDVGIVCYESTALEVRLVGGATTSEGRLEVRRSNGTWGTVCDDSWTNAASKVVCSQLGLGDRGQMVTRFGEGTGSIWLDDVSCTGSESNLGQCRSQPWGDHNCRHNEDVGIMCYESTALEVRLVGGFTTREGRLEVRRSNSTWGTVCDDSWDTADSTVACRQLGLGEMGQMVSVTRFGQGTGSIWLDDVNCTGSESNLGQCSSQPWGDHNCRHTEDVGIFCYEFPVRLQPRFGPTVDIPYGNVELYSGSTWRQVCDTNWNDLYARVACRTMGYVDGVAFCCNTLGRPVYSSTIMVRDLACTGTELSLLNCSFTTGYCSSPGSAICYNTSIDSVNMTFSVRLVNGSTNSGRVEVRHRGVWGLVCEGANWTDTAARVVCEELGFSGGGVRFGGPLTVQFYGSVWVNDLNCTGNETSLEQCVVEPWGQAENCQRPAHVLCYSTSAPKVRLAGGGSSYGRVEILMDGQTYSVCDNGWNEYDATAVCRLLGYQSGQPTLRSYYGAGRGQVALDRVACERSDTSLLTCRSSGWLETEAACGDHSKDAGVVCFGEVRLMRGDHSTGILMVNMRMNTYVVCGLGFGDTQATVACRQLGFEHGRALPRGAYGSYYGYNSRIHISCLGNETRISSCVSFQGYCGFDYDYNYASVHCFNGSLSTDLTVSLDAGQGLFGNSSGRLVVSQSGVRGRVCPEYWDDVDASVACRQLGYRDGMALAFSDAGTGPYLLGNVACTGVETSISNCQSNRTCSLSYRSPSDVGAVCFSDTRIVVELVGGTLDKEGLVQVVYGSQVGTVCVSVTYYREYAARAVCRQLGYVDGEFKTFPRGTGTVSISDVRCFGYERSLFMCNNGGLFVPPSDRCANHDFDLGVRCLDGVRLLYTIHNTNTSITGVVQINQGSNWINICNDFFDDLDAQVFCRSQDYSYSRVLPKGSMGSLYGNSFVTALNCNGTERTLLDCPVQQNVTCPWGNINSYVTVFCSQTPSARGLQAAPMSAGGHVVVMADGVKSYVCRDNWDDAAASVYCKDLGYNYGVAIYETGVSTPRDVAAYIVNSVHCTGSENSLSECSFSTNWSTCLTGYSSAAKALCYNYGSGRELRLTGGTTSKEGQVEVGFNGVWGTVCDSGFTNYDATAVCLTLGFSGGVPADSSSSSSGNSDLSSTGPFYLYGLRCSGSETSLWRCPVSSFNVTYSFCLRPSYIPRVRCTGQVKVAENAGYGVVQVLVNATSRTYGLVCDDNFTDREASVACRDLGYPYGIHLCCSAFRYRYQPIVRSGVRCTGTETLFSDCYYDTRTAYCLSGNYASIVCSSTPPGRGYTVQIDTASRGPYGRVKVQHMGYWGFVCPSGFDHNDANVICREAGYTGGWAVVDKSYYDSSTLRWLSNIDCDGSESHLSRCRNIVWGNVSDCGITGLAAVYCNRETGTQLLLVNGTQTTGRVEVFMDQGNSGSICSVGWTDVEAAVACKSMGFKSGRFLGAGTYGQGSGDLLFNRVDCTQAASSQSLMDCDLSLRGLGYRYTTCSYSSYGPAVQCFNDSVRLMGTRQENYGRVEVYINDSWTAVCDQGFDQTAAHVACRSLGFLYARAQCCSALGPLGTGPVDARQISFRVNRCRGHEATLADCDVSTSVACPSGKYASVVCSNTLLQEQTLTVRLAAPGGYYARVEVNRYGLWGPVCNSNWDDRDANATCRGLGYSHGVTFFGDVVTETPILVGGFQCSGQESSLAGCSYKDSSDDIGCSETRVASGVLCSRSSDIKLRLTDGGRHYGRLEVMYEGQWGRVISSYYFSDTNADVACRHLGFVGGQTAPEYLRRDIVTGRVWMSNINCKGYEQSLFECSNSWNSSSGSSRDAYVICYNTTRIASGNSLSVGMVQIYYNKRWGAICDGGWSEEDTDIACRDLGYNNGYHLCCSPFGRYSLPIAENVQCTGREQALTNCSHTAPQSLNYCTKDVVSVACYNGPAPSDYTFSLDGGKENNSGEVQVTFMNITGRICSDNWDDTDARVFCRELGFLTGQAFKHRLLSSRPFWMTDVHCTGSERFLRDCPKTLAAVSQCSTQLSAGVTCSDVEGVNYRLAGSNSSYKGRVEVQVNGTWGTVCVYGYSASWAKVFCRMQGFTEGSISYLGSYPDPPSKSYQNTFMCNGDEAVLDECPQSGWKTADNSYYCTQYPVKVVCFGDVRIGTRNDENVSKGPVQFYRNGTWYNLCDTGFDDVTARRVCQDLSYVDGRAVCCSAYGTASYQIKSYETNLNYTMRCQGTESDSTDCLRPGDCLSGNYASAVCFNSTDIVDEGYRFDFQDTTKTSGQVIVTHLGVAGGICNTFWDDTDARVLCKSRGHQDGAAFHYSQYNDIYRLPSERGPYWLSDINCTGSEASLGDCAFNDRLHLGNCSTADLAGAVCFNDTGIQYRLVGGDRQGAGRVEISYGGLWGTVCDTEWGDEDAGVLCRSLNYTDGYAVGKAYYGQGTGPIWLSNVRCKGSERSLAQCPHSGFNDDVVYSRWSYGCRSHTNDASVVCIDKIKLNLGFNASMGAVMVYLGKAWTLICDDDFDTNSAVAACRSLGFPHGLHVRGGVFGRVDAPIGITHVRCTGREPVLLDCSYNITTSCSSRSYASVVCSREPFVETSAKVRIMEDTMGQAHHGLINVQVEGVWGAVCAAGFGVTEATVTCKELGFAGGVPYTAHFPDRNRKPILMSDVKCRGDEKTLINCQYTTTSTTSWCDLYAPRAGVLCYNDTNGISYRLVGDTDPSRGRVEMRYGGEWGMVCVQDVTSRAGGPACRSLGHGGGLAVSQYRYEVPSSDSFWFYQLNCQGNESSLPLCTSTGFNNSNKYYYKISCKNYRTLHVECFSKDTVITNLRLAGSTTNSSGRVEVFLQGPDQWGTVCDNNWDDFDATVVCNQLGYATGKAIKNAAFGQGQGRIWLDSVGCLGTERRLQDCAFRGFSDNTCRHSNDAGVICSGVYIPPTSVSYTVTSIVTYTTVSQESLETSSVHVPTQSLLTQKHSGSYTAAIVVPVLIVAIVIVIVVAAIIYRRRGGKNIERLVNEGETRPGLMSLGVGGFISHVRDKLNRKNGGGGVNRGTDLSQNIVYYDPGLSNPVYDITVLPDKSAEDDV